MNTNHHNPEKRNIEVPTAELFADYEKSPEFPDTLELNPQGFLQDPHGALYVYRRQRTLETPFNVKPGKKMRSALYGDTLGFGNTEKALFGASGHIDASTFPYDVVYRVPSELDVLDLRPLFRREALNLRAIALSVEFTGGEPGVTRRTFERAFTDYDGFMVRRTIAQKAVKPYAHQKIAERQVPPAWLLLKPDAPITLVASKNRKEK